MPFIWTVPAHLSPDKSLEIKAISHVYPKVAARCIAVCLDGIVEHNVPGKTSGFKPSAQNE
jgi:hypothetical protein